VSRATLDASEGWSRAGCAHATVKLHAAGGRAWWACNACARHFAPVSAAVAVTTVHGAPVPEYLSVSELAQRIPYSESTIRHLMSAGTLRRDEHYVKRAGRVMFRWSAIQAWLETQGR